MPFNEENQPEESPTKEIGGKENQSIRSLEKKIEGEGCDRGRNVEAREGDVAAN